MKSKQRISSLFKTVLFFVCFVYVAIRGYESFKKYLSKPEVVDISFQYIGRMPFPSISICLFDNPWKNYHKDIFDDCNLTATLYQSDGKWVGTGNENCTDAKRLAVRFQGLDQIRLKSIYVRTYENQMYFLQMEELKSLNWTFSPWKVTRRCHTLTLPEDMVDEGRVT